MNERDRSETETESSFERLCDEARHRDLSQAEIRALVESAPSAELRPEELARYEELLRERLRGARRDGRQ